MQLLYPHRLWSLSADKKVLYLTFDDGPIPEVTPWVLDQLKHYDAKATFFCIGDNIIKHPRIFSSILEEGHKIGNHTFHHSNGFNTPAKEYLQDVLLADQAISGETAGSQGEIFETGPKIFRPPYGRLTSKQARLLRREGYKIVMWDVLSQDYNPEISPEKILNKMKVCSAAGSILVFHDSLKAGKNLREVLPELLEHYSKKGFIFESLKV